MKSRTKEERSIKNYLLGRGAEAERTRIEDRYFRDSEFHEQVLAQEDELIHDYLRGELPSSEKALFEKHFFHSDRRRQKFEFIRNLTHFADERYMPLSVPVAPKRSLLARLLGENAGSSNRYWVALPALGAAAVILAVVISILPTHRSEEIALVDAPSPDPIAVSPTPATGPSTSITPETTPRIERAEPPKPAEPKRSSPSASIPAFILTLATTSREADQSIPLYFSPQTPRIQLGVLLDNDNANAQAYEASIRTIDGEEVLRLSNLRAKRTAHGSGLSFLVETGRLPDGDYVMHVFAVPASGGPRQIRETFFTVKRM